MNDLGREYIKHCAKRIAHHNSNFSEKFKTPKWEDSLFQERLMRIGREFRLFEVDSYDTKNVESLVIASLQESFLLKN
jgi:hypothetical protein